MNSIRRKGFENDDIIFAEDSESENMSTISKIHTEENKTKSTNLKIENLKKLKNQIDKDHKYQEQQRRMDISSELRFGMEKSVEEYLKYQKSKSNN